MEFKEDSNGIIYANNPEGNRIFAFGTTVPSDATAGYAKGCIFIDTDVAGGTTGLYQNIGTSASCEFDSIVSPDTPSTHNVVAAGEFTTEGGDAAEQATVSGVLASDIVVASLLTEGASPVTLDAAAAGAGVIDFTMSADPSNDHVISYVVVRAVQ